VSTDTLDAVRVTGILAMIGALIYAVGDVFLLAAKVNIADYPNLQPHLKLLSDAEKMVVLPWWRLAWGGLLGVFATPLVLAGFWQVYQGLLPAGAGLALPPVLLFACASIVGAFFHGSFIYLGEYVQALNRVSAESQAALVGMLTRHRKILIVGFGFIIPLALIASVWFSALVASGQTWFPRWMAVVNPASTFLAWMITRRILPKRISAYTEGAGFNIAYLIFFALTTATLWQGGYL